MATRGACPTRTTTTSLSGSVASARSLLGPSSNKLAGVLGHMGSDSPNKSLVFYMNFAGAMICAVLLFIAVKRIRTVLKEKTGHY